MVNVSPSVFGKTVAPFLKEHIPDSYASIGKQDKAVHAGYINPNSKYCYRHRPDSKCRKAADETKMTVLQSELDKLSSADKQAITHVWSLFSAAPSRHRDLMLRGLLTQCCFPQLSTVSREIQEQLKIDLITALPPELSLKILGYLDTVSLCKASQVSHRWRVLADDDSVWVKMCEQHIDRKCTKCGWGLPKMERKRLRKCTMRRNEQSACPAQDVASSPDVSLPTSAVALVPVARKRAATSLEEATSGAKRQRINIIYSDSSDELAPALRERKKAWKDVYKERWQIGSNWKYGRYSTKIFTDHTNGVTCLQLEDDFLATGSYDGTIQIRNLCTGESVGTLVGHTQGIRSLQFDDKKLISGALDHTIRIWNWHTGECLSTLRCHTDGVISVHSAGEYLASGSKDKTLKIFNFVTKESYCLRGHHDWVNSVRIDAASRTVLSASDDLVCKLWDLDTKACIRSFRGHVGHVQQVIPLPDHFELDDESMTEESNVDHSDTLSVDSGHSRRSSQGDVQNSASEVGDIRATYGPAFTADVERALPPRYVLTGALDSTIRMWDTATGKCLKTFFGHVEGIWGLATDSLRIVSAANDGTIKVWDPRTAKCEKTLSGHRGPVTCIGLSDFRMASGSEDGEVRLYSFLDNRCSGVDAGTPR